MAQDGAPGVAEDGATIRAMRRPLAVLSALLLAGLTASCSAAKDDDGGSPVRDGGVGDALDLDLGLIGDDGLALDGGDGGLPVGLETAIYAHSSTTLYRLDPLTRVVTKIGDFVDAKGGAVSSMTDLALDKAGTMYGVTFTGLYRIDYSKPKPVCTKLASLGQQFNGLTFVPEGMIDPAQEVLVGVANSGDWYRVDVAAGATSATLTKLGAYGGSYSSSGDTVGIIGDSVYATVSTGALGGNDHVALIDPKTGKVTKDLGDCGAGALYGVGYWGGTLYGFSSGGGLYAINLTTGKGTKIPITGGPTEWWGAGVRTSAPRIQ